MSELEEYRNQIDRIDQELVALWAERTRVTDRVGEYKREHGMNVLDAAREERVLEAKKALVGDADLERDVVTLYETILAISRRRQRRLVPESDPWVHRYLEEAAFARDPVENPRVLYQGEPGAYTEEAAVRFFGEDAPRQNRAKWEQVVEDLQRGKADYGVLPIENSSTGSINQVYDLLARTGAYIVGEQTVKVDHCLMAPKGASLDTIEEVSSHEQGLFQCENFLNDHPGWRQKVMLNTAIAAKWVAEGGDVTRAAIGSKRAAKLYGLEVLAENINDNDSNYTRFVVVSPVMERRPGRDKVSALFTLPHRTGALHRIMTVFAVAGLNMMKLESRPVPGKNWEYLFFVDFSGDLTRPGMDKVLKDLSQAAEGFRVLGNYRAAAEETPTGAG